ncbi:Hypothetical predicted protein [Paramuricea clavata]|uniref:Uncharacterized protein n=1 Tax=Paramuricea clavata TaxID=317549 RepID=A0A7D9JUG6_PARCT|nr:Hypothetical predicted protein [Paramuricea clavata]
MSGQTVRALSNIPAGSRYTETLVVMGAYIRILTKLREVHWISRLRRLGRKVNKKCNGCKRFRAVAVGNPSPENLPTDRTFGFSAFQMIGVDYAWLIPYSTTKNRERKSYILLFEMFYLTM